MSKKTTTTPANCICPSFRIELDGVILRKAATRPYQFATRGPNHAGGSDLPKCAGKPFMGGVPVNAICRTCGTVWTAARGAMLEQVFKIRQAEWKRIRAEMTAAGADVSDILKLCTEFVNKITPASCGLAAAPATPANEQEWEVRADVVQNPAPAGKVRVMADDFSLTGEIKERAERLCFNVNLKLVKAVAHDRVRTTDSGTKFMRIVRSTAGGTARSVYCFIDLRNGDILKAASWRAPAKHARGSVMADDYGVSAVGPYWPRVYDQSKSGGRKLIHGMGRGNGEK